MLEILFPLVLQRPMYFSPLTFKDTLTFSFCPYTMQVS